MLFLQKAFGRESMVLVRTGLFIKPWLPDFETTGMNRTTPTWFTLVNILI